jgi:hypothetical protein
MVQDQIVARVVDETLQTHRRPRHHAKSGTRCFTFAEVDENEQVISADTHLQALLPWIHGGVLAKDHAFVNYVKSCNPFTQHPAYVVTGKNGFQAGVLAVPGLSGHKSVLELAAQTKDPEYDAQEIKSFQSTCCNSLCGARDKVLLTCVQCHKAVYCSKECQKVDWRRAHKLLCKKK